jgi:hypothetical protein
MRKAAYIYAHAQESLVMGNKAMGICEERREHVGNTHLRNVGKHLQDYMESQPRIPQSTCSEPQITFKTSAKIREFWESCFCFLEIARQQSKNNIHQTQRPVT